MNFQTAAHKVLDLCIELHKQGKFIEPEIDIKRKEIALFFYKGYINNLPFTNAERTVLDYSETPTEAELVDGDFQGNFETCIQLLQGLLDPVNEFKGMDLNEINHIIKNEKNI